MDVWRHISSKEITLSPVQLWKHNDTINTRTRAATHIPRVIKKSWFSARVTNDSIHYAQLRPTFETENFPENFLPCCSIDVRLSKVWSKKRRNRSRKRSVKSSNGKKSARKDALRCFPVRESGEEDDEHWREAAPKRNGTSIGRLTSRRMAPRGIHLPGPRTLHRLSNITWLMGVTRHGANFYTVTAPISTANAIFPSLFLSSLPRIKNTNRDYLAFETVAVWCNGRRWTSYWTGLEDNEI